MDWAKVKTKQYYEDENAITNNYMIKVKVQVNYRDASVIHFH